ncbi:MAG: hypothetical protein WBA07_33645 [Rivularia sp. (in: cyanobacteria)]
MIYTDNYGSWKLIADILLSEESTFISVPSTSRKIIRFSYLVDWSQWDNSRFLRSKCLYRWHYGDNKELHGFYAKLHPKKTSNIVEFNLLSPTQSLFPRELEARLVPLSYRSYFYNVGLLNWSLKIEELQND